MYVFSLLLQFFLFKLVSNDRPTSSFLCNESVKSAETLRDFINNMKKKTHF